MPFSLNCILLAHHILDLIIILAFFIETPSLSKWYHTIPFHVHFRTDFWYRPFRLLLEQAPNHHAPWCTTAQLLTMASLSWSFVENFSPLLAERLSPTMKLFKMNSHYFITGWNFLFFQIFLNDLTSHQRFHCILRQVSCIFLRLTPHRKLGILGVSLFTGELLEVYS